SCPSTLGRRTPGTDRIVRLPLGLGRLHGEASWRQLPAAEGDGETGFGQPPGQLVPREGPGVMDLTRAPVELSLRAVHPHPPCDLPSLFFDVDGDHPVVPLGGPVAVAHLLA